MLLPLLFILQITFVSGMTARERPISFKDRTEAKLYCMKNYLSCFERNRCHMKKYKELKQICQKNYSECMEFCKVMFDRLDSEDFIPHRFLHLND